MWMMLKKRGRSDCCCLTTVLWSSTFRPATRERHIAKQAARIECGAGVWRMQRRGCSVRRSLASLLHLSERLTAAMYAICDAVTMRCAVRTSTVLSAFDVRPQDSKLRTGSASRASVHRVCGGGSRLGWGPTTRLEMWSLSLKFP